jgi:hypothetical protein
MAIRSARGVTICIIVIRSARGFTSSIIRVIRSATGVTV